MPQHDTMLDSIPVGTLGIIALESSHSIGDKVNDYVFLECSRQAIRASINYT